MEQQTINQQILNELKQLRVDINIIKKNIREEEPLTDIEEQLQKGIEELRQRKIVALN